jgi:hypothetical protein
LSFSRAAALVLISVFLLKTAQAADSGPSTQVALPALVKEGTPGDLLMQDAVVPSTEGPTQLGAGSGTLQ